ncbi:hypothetical protein VTN96DRAFT_6746 [Rasamsonia emersonii]
MQSWKDRQEAAERAPRKKGPGPENASQNSLAPASLTDAPPAVPPRHAGCGCQFGRSCLRAAPALPGETKPPGTARFPSLLRLAFAEIIIMLGEESKEEYSWKDGHRRTGETRAGMFMTPSRARRDSLLPSESRVRRARGERIRETAWPQVLVAEPPGGHCSVLASHPWAMICAAATALSNPLELTSMVSLLPVAGSPHEFSALLHSMVAPS